jgi:hypothetical protein
MVGELTQTSGEVFRLANETVIEVFLTILTGKSVAVSMNLIKKNLYPDSRCQTFSISWTIRGISFGGNDTLSIIFVRPSPLLLICNNSEG